MNRFRPLLALLLLRAFFLPLPAGQVLVEEGRTVIELKIHNWIYPDPFRTDPGSRANQAAVRAFVRAFPRIFAERYAERYARHPEIYGAYDWSKVEVRPRKFTGLKVETVESDLLAIAGGVAPDVLYVNFRKSEPYIRQGFLAPLDERLAELPEEELRERIHPKVRPVIERPGPDGTTRVWALPYGGLLGKVLLYRKDRFDEAGLPYPTADWTWEDLLQACRQLTDPATGRYGIRLGRGKQEAWYWTTFLWSAGGDVLARDPQSGAWQVMFDSPEAAVALDYYTQLVTEPWTDAAGVKRYGYAYRDPLGGYTKWQRGEIAMTQGYVDEEMFDVIQPELTGMVPVPFGPGGIRGGEVNGRMMGMFSGIQDPVVRDAAWEFIRFFDSPEAQEIRTRVLVESGYGAFVNPESLEKFGYDSLLRLTPPGWREVFSIAIETGQPEPYGPHSNTVYERLSVPLQQAQDLAMNDRLPSERSERLQVLQSLLSQEASKAEKEMLGVIPAGERGRRNLAAAAALLCIVLVYGLLIRRLVRSYGQAARTDGVMPARRKRRWAALLLFPAVATVFFWQYLPLLRGSVMAFQDYRVMGGSEWVGLKNFGDVLFDRGWWLAVVTAVRYTFWVLALTFLPPLLLAILLQEVPWGRLFFRVVYYLPAVVNGLVVLLMWKAFYEESEYGLLNAVVTRIPSGLFLLAGVGLLVLCTTMARRLWRHGRIAGGLFSLLAGLALGYTGLQLALPALGVAEHPVWMRLLAGMPEPVRWLSNSETAMFACVLPLLWAGMGPGCLVYLAALKGIPDEWYEAADLDGAGFLDKTLFLVAPRLKPLLLINFVGVFVAAFFHAEANILAMTGGGSGTEVAGLHIFYKAFIFLEFGPATAMAWILGVLLIGFTIYQLRILSRLEFRTTSEGS